MKEPEFKSVTVYSGENSFQKVVNPDETITLRSGTWSANGKTIVIPEGESKAISLNELTKTQNL